MLVKYNVSKLKKAMTLPQKLNRLLRLKLFSPQFLVSMTAPQCSTIYISTAPFHFFQKIYCIYLFNYLYYDQGHHFLLCPLTESWLASPILCSSLYSVIIYIRITVRFIICIIRYPSYNWRFLYNGKSYYDYRWSQAKIARVITSQLL
jgi:hypothetical protein